MKEDERTIKKKSLARSRASEMRSEAKNRHENDGNTETRNIRKS